MQKDCPATYFVYVNSHFTGSAPRHSGTLPWWVWLLRASSSSQIHPLCPGILLQHHCSTHKSPSAGKSDKAWRKHQSIYDPCLTHQGSCSDPREKANVTATTSLQRRLCLRMFPMAVIQSKVALKLWTENSCTARLQHQDLEQLRVPWVTIPLAIFCPFS